MHSRKRDNRSESLTAHVFEKRRMGRCGRHSCCPVSNRKWSVTRAQCGGRAVRQGAPSGAGAVRARKSLCRREMIPTQERDLTEMSSREKELKIHFTPGNVELVEVRRSDAVDVWGSLSPRPPALVYFKAVLTSRLQIPVPHHIPVLSHLQCASDSVKRFPTPIAGSRDKQSYLSALPAGSGVRVSLGCWVLGEIRDPGEGALLAQVSSTALGEGNDRDSFLLRPCPAWPAASCSERVRSSERVLVTGATGLLGRAVCKEFQNNGWHVMGSGYSRARPRFESCNLLEPEAVRQMVQGFQPHVIVHCAAERRPDVVETQTEAAMQLNVNAAATVAKESAGMFLIHISTDYVFDGRDPPYAENDTPNPLNLYGKTKLEGEREVLRHNPGAAVLRVPVLYGAVEKTEESAVTVLFDKVQNGAASCGIDHCQQRFPTYVNDVASVCRQLADRRLQDPSIQGIFHFSGKEQMTKYEIACAIADAFNFPSSHLIPLDRLLDVSAMPGCATLARWPVGLPLRALSSGSRGLGEHDEVTEPPADVGARRPHNAQLDCSRLEGLGLGRHTPFKAGIKESLWPFLHDKRWRQTVFH
ncbi:MAT2B adenosyltransferase, partial [Atractosteus spatula]|nr:MAT2B adenosyltransferase [Atractosteus spatula]